jgi:aldehyde:ferredoxin oxidoreductase
LRVDLTSRTITVQDTFPQFEQYWGGAGFGMRVLWDEVAPGTHAHDAANKISINTGVLNGTGAPSSGRACMTTYSAANPWFAPSTGHFGGFFGPEL